MKDMTEEKFVELLATVVDSTVKNRLKAEREKFWLPAEEHYLDHQKIRECRDNKVMTERAGNHRYIKKLRRREKLITTTALRGTVAVMVAIVANWLCKMVGIDVGLSKFITIFK